jgi:hypothetical protein
MGDRKVGGSTIKALMRITNAAPGYSSKAAFYRGFAMDGNSKPQAVNGERAVPKTNPDCHQSGVVISVLRIIFRTG